MPKTIHRPEYTILRRKIRELRLAASMTQAEASKALGKDQSYISNIERGVRRVDVIELRDLCRLAATDFMTFMAEMESEIGTRRKQ
jgi:transcriptional regulator with XRE-family HTH domain